jgi:hypothetical protein
LVVPDTSILYPKNRTQIVCEEFERFWRARGEILDIRLVIPEMVKDELLYQMTDYALKERSKASDCFKNSCATCDLTSSLPLTEKRLRESIHRRFQKWLFEHEALVWPTPVSRIKWSELVQSAAWRHPPFSDSKDEAEKGFRDAIIIETLVLHCRGREKRTRVAFISADQLQRTTAESRVKRMSGVIVLDSIESLLANLKLFGQELEGDFLKAIQPIVTEACRDSQQRKGILSELDAINLIKATYGSLFEKPSVVPGLMKEILGETAPVAYWTPLTGEYIRTRDPRYDGRQGNRFRWISDVAFFQYFRPNPLIALFCEPEAKRDRLRGLFFRVRWEVSILKDGTLRSPSILGPIEPIGSNFEAPSTDVERVFGIHGPVGATQ